MDGSRNAGGMDKGLSVTNGGDLGPVVMTKQPRDGGCLAKHF